MGYLHELWKIKNDKLSIITSLSYLDVIDYFKNNYNEVDLDDLDTTVYLPNLLSSLNAVKIYEFGKDYENSDNLITNSNPFFQNTETNEYYSEYSPYVINKDGLLSAIEFYRIKILNYYKSFLLSDDELYELGYFKNNNERIMSDIKQKIFEWNNKEHPPYNLNGDVFINSWLYEYEIFSLVYIYKTTDWENESIVFCGH